MLRRWAKGSAVVLSALLTATTLLLGAAALRLSWGPISLGGLTKRLEAEINAGLAEAAPGWRASLGGARIQADAGGLGGARLGLTDLTLRDPDGTRAFRAPNVFIKLDALQAALGEVKLAAIGVEGARVMVERAEHGGWRLALDTEAPPAAEASALAPPPTQQVAPAPDGPEGAVAAESALLAEVIDAWSDASDREGALGRLRQISVRDAQVVFRDRITGETWSAPATHFDLSRPAGGGVQARLETAVDFAGPHGAAPARLTALAERPRGGAVARLTLRFENAPAAPIARQIAGGDLPFDISGLLSGEADAALDLATGRLAGVSATLRGEGTRLAARRLGAAEPVANEGSRYLDPLARSAFEAAFDFDPAIQELTLRRLRVAGDRLRAEIDGRTRLSFDGPVLTGAEGALAVRSAEVLDPGLFAEPLVVERGGFAFALDGLDAPSGPPRLALSDISLRTPEVSATGAATAVLAPPVGGDPESLGALLGVRADLDLTLSAFPAERLAALWPLPAAPGGRDWVAENILGGTLTGGRLKARIGGGVAEAGEGDGAVAPVETVDFDFHFEELRSLYLGAMPPIEGGAGAGRITADRFDLTVEAGAVTVGEAGVVRIDGSRFAIPTFEPEFPPAEIDLVSSGPARAVLSLIDLPPLALPRKLGLDPATVTGRLSGEVTLAFPLAKDLPVEDVAVSASAALDRVSLPIAAAGGRRASAPSGRLVVDQDKLRLEAGAARLEGYEDVAIRAVWREVFAPAGGAARTRLDLAGKLTAAQLRAHFGAPDTANLAGEAAVSATITARDGAPAALDLTATLDDLALAPRYFGWRKPAGTPGVLEARALISREAWSVEKLSASAPGLSLSGSARLTADGAWRVLDLDALQVGEGTDLSLKLERGAEGELSVYARGARADLSGLWSTKDGGGKTAQAPAAAQGAAKESEAKESEAKKGARPLSLDARLDRLTFGPGAAFRDVRLAASRSAKGGLYGDVEARVARGVARGSIRPGEQGAVYRFETTDAGATLAALGFVNSAERGEATLTARERPNGAIAGTLKASNVVITDAPALADILSVASVVGIFDLASSGGISFTSIEAPFVLDARRLTLSEAIVSGPSLGMAFEGHLERDTGLVDISGTLSPAYVLNGLPGRLPVIGDILTGGDGDGVISVAFNVTGPVRDPKVDVQPLSVLTPGPLKRIFRD